MLRKEKSGDKLVRIYSNNNMDSSLPQIGGFVKCVLIDGTCWTFVNVHLESITSKFIALLLLTTVL